MKIIPGKLHASFMTNFRATGPKRRVFKGPNWIQARWDNLCLIVYWANGRW